eukprot:2807347-Amphidinium_carterae.1
MKAAKLKRGEQLVLEVDWKALGVHTPMTKTYCERRVCLVPLINTLGSIVCGQGEGIVEDLDACHQILQVLASLDTKRTN